MLALKIVFAIVLAVLYLIMMSVMIILERDKPRNIIIWSFLFLVSQIVGYFIYVILKLVVYKKKQSLCVKMKEDEIYLGLVNVHLKDVNVNSFEDFYKFNELAYNAHLTQNNSFEIFKSYESFKNNLKKEIKDAKEIVLFELSKFEDYDIQDVLELLSEKVKQDVTVKIVYDRRISSRLKKTIKKLGLRLARFSKHNALNRLYSNQRNQIVIDNKVAYLCNMNVKRKHLTGKHDIADMYMMIKGDVVQEIAMSCLQDSVFATNKFIPYVENSEDKLSNNCTMQYVTNNVNTDIELLIIKAICSATKTIQLQLDEFIPTESIMSLLKFAINSNIDVRLMVPIKANESDKYYATRAYAKELALLGANVYLFDGFIRFNAITIDSKHVLYGSYSLDREHINLDLQSILVITDQKAVNSFNKAFDDAIKNSYRINNAKYMMLKEKFFKNFV